MSCSWTALEEGKGPTLTLVSPIAGIIPALHDNAGGCWVQDRREAQNYSPA